MTMLLYVFVIKKALSLFNCLWDSACD